MSGVASNTAERAVSRTTRPVATKPRTKGVLNHSHTVLVRLCDVGVGSLLPAIGSGKLYLPTGYGRRCGKPGRAARENRPPFMRRFFCSEHLASPGKRGCRMVRDIACAISRAIGKINLRTARNSPEQDGTGTVPNDLLPSCLRAGYLLH